MEGGFAYNPPGFGPVGSFGKPPADVLVMDAVADDGTPVAPGEVGELVVRPVGGAAEVAYYRNPEASAKKVRDGWLRTGDMVTRDADGWFFFCHRREDGGLRKMGEFVSESFVRRAIAEYPDVRDVHVYGVPSAAGAPGETDIVAAIVVANRSAFDVDLVLAHGRRSLERSHVPDVIQLVAELPVTPSAKVQTRSLAALLKAEPASVLRPVAPAR
jgi:crotonobetaine/carnitine-CoA ligase